MINQTLQMFICLDIDLHLPLIDESEWSDDEGSLAIGVRGLALRDEGDPEIPVTYMCEKTHRYVHLNRLSCKIFSIWLLMRRREH
jgi:hypothetical protein